MYNVTTVHTYNILGKIIHVIFIYMDCTFCIHVHTLYIYNIYNIIYAVHYVLYCMYCVYACTIHTTTHNTNSTNKPAHIHSNIVLTVHDVASIDYMPCNCVEEDAGIS